jgi:hypothetical protein
MTRFTTQPQGVALIDWGNPITQGLAFANLPALWRDSVSGKGCTFTGLVSKVFQGNSIIIDGSVQNNLGFSIGSTFVLGGASNSTFIGVASRYRGTTNHSVGGSAIYCERTNASGVDIYKLETTNTGLCRLTLRDDAATLLQFTTPLSNNQFTDNAPHFYACRRAVTVATVWADDSTNTVSAGVPSGTYKNANPLRTLGSDALDASAVWDGRIDLAAGWLRALGDAEIRSLRANPWQIFRRPVGITPWAQIFDQLMGQACC